MPDELLGPLFDDLRLHEGSEGSHDAFKKEARDHVKDESWKEALPPCLGLELCCRVSSNHQLLSKLGMEWVPLPGLLSLPTPKLAEY